MVLTRFRRWAIGSRLGLILTAAFLTTSCSHTLEVKNLGLYKPTFMSSIRRDIRIGVLAVTSAPEEERLVLGAVNALKRDGFKVTYPFFSNEENRQAVDYVVKLTTSSEYRGSGWNFWINWPGFLIWTPAWHGYDYGALYHFDADITETKTGTELPQLSAPVDLDIRHAAINRTWTEISWFEWSVIAFIGGLVFMRYDKSVTPLLLDATETKIADYVASKIEAAISSSSASAGSR